MAQQTARDKARSIAKRRAEESTHAGGGGFAVRLPDGVEFYKNEGKKVEWDFIPYVISDKRNPDVLAGRANVGDQADVRAYWSHSNIGPEQKMVVCLRSVGKPCPICEEIAVMRKNTKIDPKDIDAIKQKERMLYNILDPNETNGPIRVWDVSYYLFTKKLEKEQKEREEYYDYWFLDGGYTLSIRFEKKSMGKGTNSFYEADRIDFEKRQPYNDDILKEVVDLDSVLNIMSYENLQKLFLGVEGEPDPEPEVDAKPAAEAAAPRERSRGRGSEDSAPVQEEKIHHRSPDAPEERTRHESEYKNELESCPGKTARGAAGVFGVDTDKLDYCDAGKGCPKWDACGAEKKQRAADARKQDAPKDAPAAETRGRGREPEEKETTRSRRSARS
jgi:hypothetical protein